MKLFEFQGKSLFREYGLAVPQGRLCKKNETPDWSGPVVLKAQVLSGGRGRAGAVILCESEKERDAALEKLFSMTLKEEPVNAVLAEERVTILHEYYLSVAFDGEAGTPLIIVGASGGVDVERLAEEHPEQILKLPFDAVVGPLDSHFRKAARFAGASRPKEFAAALSGLYRLWRETHALLVEVNPLAETPGGFVALDAKVELDDDAEPLHRELFARLRVERAGVTGASPEPQGDTITCIPLDGDIGLISDGAGTGMLTLDLLRDHGGRAADFCEMGGTTSPEVMYAAMERVIDNPKVPKIRSLLIVLIGGFNRMDEMAQGIVRYVRDTGFHLPIVVRLCGTMEEEGKKIMREAGLPICDDLEQAVREAVGETGRRAGDVDSRQ
ncbi:MAG: hypothetical protein LBR61_01195 [Synergistaceae bacterium]|jgi:succinyl-CoA synthetase beta subunit|nr:hypothetical protein [Synergistaceae bacterium]